MRQLSRCTGIRAVRWTFALVVLSACTGGDAGDGDGSQATLDPVGLPRATLVEEFRLDADTEDFPVVRDIVPGPDGIFALPLPQDRQVVFYDGDGRRIATAGRRGQGPGEFQHMGDAGWVADTLWIYDGIERRVTHIDRNGSVLRTTQLPSPRPLEDPTAAGEPRDLMMFSPSVVHANGDMLGSGRYHIPEENLVSGNIIALVTAAGPSRLILEPPAFEDPRWSIQVDGFGAPLPFAMGPSTAISPDGERVIVLVGETIAAQGSVRLSSIAVNGDTVFSRLYSFTGVPIPGSARDSAIAAMVPSRPFSEGPPDLVPRRQAIARERMPPVFAPIRAMRVGLDGRIWLELRESGEGRIALILNQGGNPIGSVLIPGRSVIRQANATHVWMTEPDEDGLASVVRYRIEGVGRD